MRFASRGLGAALAAVMAISPLLGTLHESSVRHVACPEDGELVEVPVQRAHAHARAAVEHSIFPEVPVVPSAPGADHDHCAIAQHLRGTFGVTASRPAAGFLGAAATPLPDAPDQSNARGLALYRLAPKASPPH